MEKAELLHALAEVAEAAGLEVRAVGGTALTDGGPAAESGTVRLRERVIVLLSRSDPLDQRIEIVATALREHAGPWLDSHFVTPAVRECVSER